MSVIAMGVIVALITAVIGPVMAERSRRRSQREDWARQDEVAARLLAANSVTNDKQDAADKKLDVIHVLVNSTLTAALQGELDATIRDLASMREVVDLKLAAEREPGAATLDAIERAEVRIDELRLIIKERLEAQKRANNIKGL